MDLKLKYNEKRLRKVTATTIDGEKIVYILVKPNRNTIEAAGRAKDNVPAANKILLANCVLAGDADALQNDGEVYAAIMRTIVSLMKSQQATVEKL